jgi:hypothetical protein
MKYKYLRLTLYIIRPYFFQLASTALIGPWHSLMDFSIHRHLVGLLGWGISPTHIRLYTALKLQSKRGFRIGKVVRLYTELELCVCVCGGGANMCFKFLETKYSRKCLGVIRAKWASNLGYYLWAEPVARMEETKNAYKILVGKPLRTRPLIIPRRR